MGFFDNIFKKETAEIAQPTPADKQTETSLIPKYPEKEFGVQLVQLVEVALADKILTTSERAVLRDIAISKGIDLDRFEAYVDMLKEKRGVKEVDDGIIPLKKYNQPTEVASELKTMIDMALADGYLSDEERKIILNEAAKLGVNLPVFENGLNAIFMTGRIKSVIDSKYPTTIIKRLVKSEDIADGKVVETYEEITTAFRPNTNRGKENELIKTTTKKIIKVTRKKEMIEDIIDFLCSVDYTMVLTALSVVTVFSPVVGGAAISLVSTLKGGVDRFNQSGQKKEPKLFFEVVFSEVSDKGVALLPNVQNYLGENGGKLVSGLITAQKAYNAYKGK
ncbi:MAG: TerB family tellurite resistance protein [Paramuribaculum sp.]|nr:TerB family tellurite resistance protein [Paramuribaculum sp.]